MSTALRWTSADLDALPDDGKRYEIIDGELYMSKQPHWHHQTTCGQIFAALQAWNRQTKLGRVTVAPGVIFGEEDDVAPDVVWVSRERFATLDAAGHLRAAPELAVEVLSFGRSNERRDREAKLKLYSRRGVKEYWIVDWMLREVEVYRREENALRLIETLHATDTLRTPLLPGFACRVAEFFDDLPASND